MGLHLRLLCLLFLWSAPLIADEALSHRILFMLRSGYEEEALQLYQDHYLAAGEHDFELIQEMGLRLLQRGVDNPDPECVVMALFGAGISMDESAVDLLESALKNPSPEVQLAALRLLSNYPHNETEKQLRPLLNSTHLLLRLEALLVLAAEKNGQALAQAETLMNKLPSFLHSIFPRFYAMIGTPAATKGLRRLMVHPNEEVRKAAIISAASHGRDDLLPDIFTLCRTPNPGQQEVCAVALTRFRNEKARPILLELTHSKERDVRLAAHHALYCLGQKESRHYLLEQAREGYLLAVPLLADVDEARDLLASLLHHPDRDIAINAAISLLEMRDRRCLPAIGEILSLDVFDNAVLPHTSQGGGLRAWRSVSTQQSVDQDPQYLAEMTVQLREDLLHQAMSLPEADYLSLVSTLFKEQQNDLIPAAITGLEQLGSQSALNLLKSEQQRLGAPLIRHYCNLALYRLGEEGPYGDQLREWVSHIQQECSIAFRPLLPLPMREEGDVHTITPEETSRLLVETYATFAQAQDDAGIASLFSAIAEGNPKNRYALAGLLMRATQ